MGLSDEFVVAMEYAEEAARVAKQAMKLHSDARIDVADGKFHRIKDVEQTRAEYESAMVDLQKLQVLALFNIADALNEMIWRKQ